MPTPQARTYLVPPGKTLHVAFLLIVLVVTGFFALPLPAAAQTPGGDGANESPPNSEPDTGSDFYGINFVHPYEPWLSLAWETGARVVRWQFNWRDHETSPGVWDWTRSDEPIRNWKEAGFKIHAILHNPPDFALANPGSGLMPTNLNLPWNDPANGWGTYCYQFAGRYQGQIDSYEVWNEPDLDQYWEGNAQQYFYALRTCYQAIKAADPNAPVAMAGMAMLVEREFLPEVVRLAATDPDGAFHNYYFDIANIHMYADPELVYNLTLETRSILDSHGLIDKPIWITETNVPLRGAGGVPNTPHWGYATEQEAAWYVIQAASNAHAAGAARLMFFRLADDDMDEAFGLLRNDKTPRPGYRTLQIATTFLRDITFAAREVRDGVVITELQRTDGARIVVLYSKTGTGKNVSIQAQTPVAVVINASGGYTALSPNSDGTYTVYLPPASGRDFSRIYNYSVGGPPVILVEHDTDPPGSSLKIVPIPLDKTHVLVQWRGNDGEYGTGIANYSVEVSHNGGPWGAWLSETKDQEAIYDISAGGQFAFRVQAIDRAGNLGEFSEPAAIDLRLTGTLVAQIVDLRGQNVPYARIEMADGSLHDADQSGWARIDLPPGPARVAKIDGSAHGKATPDPVEIVLGEETLRTWMLTPLQDLIHNGKFDMGLQGWEWSPSKDVYVDLSNDPQRGTVLHLGGRRRPWGQPAAWTTMEVPPSMLEGVLSFYYRLPKAGQTLLVRTVDAQGQQTVWQSNAITPDFTRIWVDMSAYAGQKIALRFEIWGPKDSGGGMAEIDEVIFGNVPVLDSDGVD